MPVITIAGAGISGLTCAINLAKAGLTVRVVEKNQDVGCRFNGDFQGIENWSTQEDALNLLQGYGIRTDFYHFRLNELDFFDNRGIHHLLKSRRTGCYMVRRGNGDDCLDRSLLSQAMEHGVEVQFGQRLAEADIDATGPEKASLIASGFKFATDRDTQISAMLIDDRITPKGYGYMFVRDGRGCLLVTVINRYSNLKSYALRTYDRFMELYPNLKIENRQAIGGYGNFCIRKQYPKIEIGEKAGFQDCLWGFGMRMAFMSGYYAAQSIINKTSYDGLVQRHILPYVKSSFINRYLVDRFNLLGNGFLINRITSDSRDSLTKLYRYSVLKRLLFFFLFNSRLRRYGIVDETSYSAGNTRISHV
jgi:flavin-dependent dehydrogenase